MQPNHDVPEQPSFHDDYDDNECAICMDAVKCTTFVPCGHTLCCQSCAKKVTDTCGRWPLCDSPADGFCDTQPATSSYEAENPTQTHATAVCLDNDNSPHL